MAYIFTYQGYFIDDKNVRTANPRPDVAVRLVIRYQLLQFQYREPAILMIDTY